MSDRVQFRIRNDTQTSGKTPPSPTVQIRMGVYSVCIFILNIIFTCIYLLAIGAKGLFDPCKFNLFGALHIVVNSQGHVAYPSFVFFGQFR